MVFGTKNKYMTHFLKSYIRKTEENREKDRQARYDLDIDTVKYDLQKVAEGISFLYRFFKNPMGKKDKRFRLSANKNHSLFNTFEEFKELWIKAFRPILVLF